MTVYTSQQSSRLLYVLNFIFGQFSSVRYRLVHSEDEYCRAAGPKINYSATRLCDDEIHIVPAGFLASTSVEPFTPEVATANSMPILFPAAPALQGAWHFDVLSAVFYMLSRYEEYNSKKKDKYGRFPAKESLASRHHFLHLPVADIWLTQLFNAIGAKHAGFTVQRTARVCFSYDIDVAYAYKGREMVRQAGSAVKDLLRVDAYNLAQRTAVLAGYLEDPFDTYEYIKQESINPICFFLLSEKKTKYDRNIQPGHPVMHTLIAHVSQWCPVGIHPSFYSSDKPALLASEIQALSAVLLQPVTQSRQHYLKFRMPHTFRQLVANGIREDYSMAFAETPGFRAGTCTPFYFFDVETNEATPLLLFPACLMESTFRDDIIMPVQQALPLYIQYFETVRQVNGLFLCIWHNDTLAANNKLNFRWLHQQILQYIRSHS